MTTGTPQSVAKNFVTTIVSGRSTQKVIDFVKLDEFFYAGSHGLTFAVQVDEARLLHGSEAVHNCLLVGALNQ